MQPWFFDLLGITSSGSVFETYFFLTVAAVGGLVLARELRLRMPWDESWFARCLGGAMVGFGCWRMWAAQQGDLMFGATGLQIPTYGVAMASGFGIGIWLTWRAAVRAPDKPLEPVKVLDAAFVIILVGVLGARCLALLSDRSSELLACVGLEGAGPSLAECGQLLRFWDGGLAFYGGIISGLLAAVIWCRVSRVDTLALGDLAIPYVALGHAIGRLGCLAAGCCRGAACDVRHGITFPEGGSVWETHWMQATAVEREWMLEHGSSLPTYPTQLYEALIEVLLMGWLVFVVLPRRQYVGQLLVHWLALYAVARTILELFRGDEERGFVVRVVVEPLNALLGVPPGEALFLSTSQTIALGMFALALGIRWWARRRQLLQGG